MSEISFNFTGKNALVTGGTKGIGRDIVRALAEAKCSPIYVTARTAADLDRLKNDFPCVVPICVDLRDWDATRKAVQEIETVDFLVNNAGAISLNDLCDFTQEQFDDLFSINVKAVTNVSQIVCAKMMENGGGAVVNVSSLAGIKSVPNVFLYEASKHALDGITKHMAMELAPKVRVNSIQPGITWTEMLTDLVEKYPGQAAKIDESTKKIPMQRMVKVEECSNATLFLLSTAAGMTTGHCFPLTGGEY